MIQLNGHIVGVKDKNGLYCVLVPFFNLWTQSETVEEAAEMARDSIGLLLESKSGGHLSADSIRILKKGKKFILYTDFAEVLLELIK